MFKPTYTLVLGPPYRRIDGYPGTRGKNTRDSVSWTGTVPVPTVPGTRQRVPGSQPDGVQLHAVLVRVFHAASGHFFRCVRTQQYFIPGTWYQVPYLVPGTWYLVLFNTAVHNIVPFFRHVFRLKSQTD